MRKLLRASILITVGMLIICIISGCGDDLSEEVTDPPQPEDDVGPASATEVVMDPTPRESTDGFVYRIPPNVEFALTFDEGVVSVTVNGTPATGSGLNWKWSAQPVLPYGSVTLKIKWINRDGSGGFATSGPYEVAIVELQPPTITSGTVADGDVDVDPAPINAGGFRFGFDEDVTGTITLTDEAGADLNWIANVAGQTATLTAIAGQELVNETTYKIEINVQDSNDCRFQTTITFVTKPK